MWDGAFAPRVRKVASGCDHGSIYVDVGEAEFGLAPIWVQFNHTCPGGSTPPSNNNTYTFEIELDEFTSGETDAVLDLRAQLAAMTDSEKLAWVSNNLVWDTKVDSLPPVVLP